MLSPLVPSGFLCLSFVYPSISTYLCIITAVCMQPPSCFWQISPCKESACTWHHLRTERLERTNPGSCRFEICRQSRDLHNFLHQSLLWVIEYIIIKPARVERTASFAVNQAAGPIPSLTSPCIQSQHCSKAAWFNSQEQEATLVNSASMPMNLIVLLKKWVEQTTRPTNSKNSLPFSLILSLLCYAT